MLMDRIDISLGTDIHSAIKQAIRKADAIASRVSFTFNGTEVTVQPGDSPDAIYAQWSEDCEREAEAYRQSPEGRRQARQREIEIANHQEIVDQCLSRLPSVVRDEPALMEWLAEFQPASDDAGVRWDKAETARVLTDAGWKRSDCVGLADVAYRKPAIMARYIVGQVIDCLEARMPPHPITLRFVEQYREAVSAVAQTDEDV